MEIFRIRIRLAPPYKLRRAVKEDQRTLRSVYNWYLHRFYTVPDNFRDYPSLPTSELKPKARETILKYNFHKPIRSYPKSGKIWD